MKLETKSGSNFNSTFLTFKIPFTRKSFRVHALLYNTPEAWVHGYSSRTEQGKYILFHDYDSLSQQDVENELKFLQKRFKLSEYYLFKLDRPDSFHAVCLDTFSLAEAYEIQKTTSCDLAFIHSIKNLQSKEWVLRIGEKGNRKAPEFLKRIGSGHYQRIKSTAHTEFLIKYFKVFCVVVGKFDGCKKLSIVDFNTSNRTEQE